MKKDYTCQGCGVDTRNKRNFYMVQDHLWERHGVGNGMLCLNCFQGRLGRELRLEDFKDVICNTKGNPYYRELVSKQNKQI